MKRMLAVCAAMAAMTLFGAANDLVLTLSTKGPDTYRDGTRVLDRERYAVVWTKTGATFGGFAADGRLLSENDRLVLAAPLARDGRCPETVFEIAASAAEAYKGGTFALYLLDTRVKTAGGVALAADTNGGTVVNSAGTAGRPVSATAGIGTPLAADAVSLGDVGVAAAIDRPVITAIEAKGAQVTLRVRELSAAATYYVVPAGSAQEGPQQALKAERKGDRFVFEKGADAGFYQVIGVRNF